MSKILQNNLYKSWKENSQNTIKMIFKTIISKVNMKMEFLVTFKNLEKDWK